VRDPDRRVLVIQITLKCHVICHANVMTKLAVETLQERISVHEFYAFSGINQARKGDSMA